MQRFYLRIIRAMPRALRYRKEIAVLDVRHRHRAGALVVGGGMFFVVMSIAFFTGTEVGLEGFTGLSQIGAQAFTGVISSLANTREITPLVAGVALAAQVGAGFTAQLGAMRISEEIDALEVMGVNSVVYLVATRVWAALITMVPLYLAALFSSFLATELIVTKFFGLSTGTYQHYFQLFLPPIDIFYSFVKAMVFAVAGHPHPLLLRLQRHRRARPASAWPPAGRSGSRSSSSSSSTSSCRWSSSAGSTSRRGWSDEPAGRVGGGRWASLAVVVAGWRRALVRAGQRRLRRATIR